MLSDSASGIEKLRFHTTNNKGESKCHKLHVGKKCVLCPELKVHGVPMQDVSEDKYLGDILSSDGKNTKNIQDRFSKGNGIISKIFSIIDTLCFGPYMF